MLTVIGDLIADVVVLGASTMNVGTDNPATITHTRGGSAANVAAAAARLLPARFVGRVGADAEGTALAQALGETGVDVRVQRAGRTGVIVILVDDTAERTMLTDRGAAAELDSIDPVWLEGTRWLHLPLYGFAMTASHDALLDAARWVHRRRGSVSLDLSSAASLREHGADALRGILSSLSPEVVFANGDEARLLAHLGVLVSESTVFVVKRGADPVRVVTGGVLNEVAVERVEDPVDSTGAGDAFAAGYLAAAISGRSPVDSVKAGAALAIEALRRPGAL